MHISDSNILLIGLPDAGKTTFLVALDEILQHQPQGAALRSVELAGNRAYLMSVRTAWLKGEKVGRTIRSAANEPTELIVEDTRTGKRTTLAVPDMSGEVFEEQWESHVLSDEYKARITKADGILLFVSAIGASRNEIIEAAWKVSGDPNDASPWQKKEASPQVKVVELLQLIIEARPTKLPMKVAVLISAWDLVEKAPADVPKTPKGYLEREWPLLHQFLSANPEGFVYHIYGVSARGGDDSAQAELLKLPEPADRVRIVDDQTSSKDLTVPVRWLLSSLQ